MRIVSGDGADEDEAGRGHRCGKLGVLGKKAVAGVDGAGAGLAGGGDDRVGVEIALRRRRRTDADRLVGKAHRKALPVGLAEHRDRAQPKLLRRANDAHRDLTAIGDQELVEHA